MTHETLAYIKHSYKLVTMTKVTDQQQNPSSFLLLLLFPFWYILSGVTTKNNPKKCQNRKFYVSASPSCHEFLDPPFLSCFWN